MLPGVIVKNIKKNPDERGSFREIFRDDWGDFNLGDKIVQANLSYSYPGVIRAWHRHDRGQVDYFVVIDGSIKICAYDNKQDSKTYGQLDEIIVSGDDIKCVRIPGFYLHGFKSISDKPATVVYLTTRMYDYNNPDEERISPDDPTIIDPKTKEPYKWD